MPHRPPGATVSPQPCAAAPGGLCGTLEVPFDRSDPALGTTTIAYELYPHRDASVPAAGLLTTNAGGPGVSNTFFRDAWLASFEPLLDRYDVLLMDDRGRGDSDPIDCPAAQHGIGAFYAGTAACGAQLGALAGAYGTAASAVPAKKSPMPCWAAGQSTGSESPRPRSSISSTS